MRRLLLAFCFVCGVAGAQTLSFSIYDKDGGSPDLPLPATYQFSATPQGSSATIWVRATNQSVYPVNLITAYVGIVANSPQATPDFTVTDEFVNRVLAAGQSTLFAVHFTPSATGPLTGYLQAAYAVKIDGCTFTGESAASATPCPGQFASASTLTGAGQPPQLVLSYHSGTTGASLQPSATTPLNFGQVATSSSSTFTFTITNETNTSLPTPAVTLPYGLFLSSPFLLDTSSLPATIPANGTGTFTVKFSPGQTGLQQATLNVGNNKYLLQGTGAALSATDALEIYYLDSAGVRTAPQTASPIDFGQIVPGSATPATLKFTVRNPQTALDPVTVPNLTLTGAAYTLSSGPVFPAKLIPGASLSFSITFSAAASGSFKGMLAIANRTFSLTGLSVVSPVPVMSLDLSISNLNSGQQPTVMVTAASAATKEGIGQLSLAFAPTVAGVSDDAAVMFLQTAGRQLTVDLPAGATAANFKGVTAIPFQTGTTAGTLTFALTFPNTPPLTKSFTLSPALVQISTSTGTRSDPNLVLTLNGFDNTYSAAKLTFNFYDAAGKAINSKEIAVDAATDFHQFFFTENQTGGLFGLQATFPVVGDITKIASASVTLANSVGSSTAKIAFP